MTPIEMQNIISALQALTMQRDELNDRIDALRSLLLTHTQPGETILSPSGEKVAEVVIAGRRFNPKTAMEVLPAERLAQITHNHIDAKLARETLTKDEYDRCLTGGRPSLRLTRGEQ